MTLHTPRDDARSATPVAAGRAEHDPAERRAFVRDWIASREKRVAMLVGGLALAPLMLAGGSGQAQVPGDTLVRADTIPGVRSVALNPDGSASLTLTNGQVVNIAASSVTVLADGTIAITVAAAEFVASTVAAAGLGGASGAGAAAIGGALGVAAALGSAKADDPDVTVALASGRGTLNAAELASGGSFVGRTDPDTEVRITIGDVVLTGRTDEDGNYDIPFGPGQLTPPDGPLEVLVEVFELDDDDEPLDEPLYDTSITLVVDTVPPVIAISVISGDDQINIADSQANLTVSGTSDAENGQVVTVTVNGATYTGQVSGGVWSVTVPAAALQALPDGAVVVSASVADRAGNANSADRTVQVDLTAPSITIDALPFGEFLNIAEVAAGQTISGTAPGAEGRTVTLTLRDGGGNTVTLAPVADAGTSAWSQVVSPTALGGLADGPITITATVSDSFGNPAPAAVANATKDTVPPTISVGAVAVDNIINIAERADGFEVSGTTNAPAGQVVTVTINGTPVANTGTVQAGGGWTVTILPADVAALGNGATPQFAARVADPAGNETTSANFQATVDLTPPAIAVTAIAGDGFINIVERGDGITVEGTTNAEVGRTVTVTLTQGGTTTDSPAQVLAGGVFVAIFNPAQLGLFADGPVDATAAVTNAVGNANTSAPLTGTVDLIPPAVSIDPLTGNDVLTLANRGNEVTVTGSTDAEAGTVVQVTFNGAALADAVVVAGGGSGGLPNSWTTTIPGTLTGVLEDEEGVDEQYSLTARATDEAGNPSAVVSRSIATDFSQPSISIAPIAADDGFADSINATEAGLPLVITGSTGNVPEGAVVTVRILDGSDLIVSGTGTTAADGSWSVTFATPAAIPLGDDLIYTVTADVDGIDDIPADTATRSVRTDFTPPEINMSSIAGDGVINIAEEEDGFTVSGTSDQIGAIVTVTIDGVPGTFQSAPVTALGAWSVNIPGGLGLSGAVTFTAAVADNAGNTASDTDIATTDFTLPVIAFDPLPVGDSPATALNATDAASVIFSGTSDVWPLMFQVREVGGAVVAEPLEAMFMAGAWTVTFTTLASALVHDTPYEVVAFGQNAAGNVGQAVSPPFLTDYEAPTFAGIAVAGDGFINIAEADAGFTVTGNTDASEVGRDVTLRVGATVVGSGTVGAGGAWAVTVDPADLPPLTDGLSLDFVASVTDAASNVGTSGAVTATVDFTRPVVTINAVAGDDVINAAEAGSGFVLSGTTTGMAEGSTVTVTFGALEFQPVVGAGGGWSVTLTGTEVTGQVTHDVPVAVTASATNAIGNPSLPVSRDVPVDLVAPDITFDPLPFGSFLNADDVTTDQTISGSTTGAEGLNIEIRLFSDGVERVLRSVPTDPDTGDWSATFTAAELQALPQGELAINARAVDAAGNVRNQTVEATVDTMPPVVTITAVQSGGDDLGTFLNIAARDAGIVVIGTSDDPVDVTVTVTSGAVTVETTASPDGSGAWIATFDASAIAALPEGVVTITAAATDAAGNTGTAAPESLTADFTPPTIAINPVGDAEGVIDLNGVSSTFTISGTTDAPVGQTVTVTFRGETYEGVPVVADPEGGPDNVWSVDVPANQLAGLAPGVASPPVEARVSDPAGNEGTTDSTFVIYEAAWTYLTSIPPLIPSGGPNDLFMVYQIDPSFAVDDRLFFIDVRLDILSASTSYPLTGFSGLSQPFPYQTPFFLSGPNSSAVADGNITFLAVWLAELDGEGDVISPAIGDPSFPILGFRLNVGDSETVVELLSRANTAPSDGPGDVDLTGNSFGGQHWSAIGTAGDDTIVAPNVDSLIRGRGGDDQIDVSGIGVNTIIFEADPTANGVDTVTGFDVGVPRADRIGFADLAQGSLRGDGTGFESLADPGALGANTGFLVLTTALADLDAALDAAAAGFGAADGDVFYLMATDGTNAVLAQVAISGSDATATVMANFTGLGDLNGITDDTILGFSSI